MNDAERVKAIKAQAFDLTLDPLSLFDKQLMATRVTKKKTKLMMQSTLPPTEPLKQFRNIQCEGLATKKLTVVGHG